MDYSYKFTFTTRTFTVFKMLGWVKEEPHSFSFGRSGLTVIHDREAVRFKACALTLMSPSSSFSSWVECSWLCDAPSCRICHVPPWGNNGFLIDNSSLWILNALTCRYCKMYLGHHHHPHAKTLVYDFVMNKCISPNLCRESECRAAWCVMNTQGSQVPEAAAAVQVSITGLAPYGGVFVTYAAPWKFLFVAATTLIVTVQGLFYNSSRSPGCWTLNTHGTGQNNDVLIMHFNICPVCRTLIDKCWNLKLPCTVVLEGAFLLVVLGPLCSKGML